MTVDTCNSELQTNLYVFTGVDLDTLDETGRDDNVDGGPCPAGRGVTFNAVSGTVYWIFVDGNGFSLPGGSPPATEGSFELKVEEPPRPANDDLAGATELAGSSFGGSYNAHADGYNWSASKEAGEPEHAGDPGGASVWYRWTAPASGHVELGACNSFDVLVSVYTGNAVSSLSAVPLESRPTPCFVNFAASAGTTYHIAVDGRFDSGLGLPHMSSFDVRASMDIPEPVAGGEPILSSQPRDTRPPNTRIVRQVLKPKPPVFVFRFRSNERGSTFRCKLDRQKYRRCGKVKRFRCLRGRRHVLRVFAVDSSGNRDRSPAVARFKTKCTPHPRSPRRHRRR